MARKSKWSQQQMLRDPNKRKNIPTSQLPPKYRAARLRRLQAERDSRNPLLNPTIPLSGSSLRTAADDLVEAETRPALNAATRERDLAAAQGPALAQRYAGLGQHLGQVNTESQARAAAIAERARAALAKIAQEGQNAVNASGAAAQDALGQKGTGLEGSAAARLASERAALSARQADVATQYRSSNEVLSGVDQTYGVRVGQVNQARLAERAGAAAIRQANNVAKLEGERADIEAARGPLRAKAIQDLRQRSFENTVVGQELGIKQQSIEQEERESRRQARTQRENAKLAAETSRENNERTTSASRYGVDIRSRDSRLGRQNARELARIRASAKDSTRPETDYSKKQRTNIDEAVGRFQELEQRFRAQGLKGPQIEREIKRVMQTKDRVPDWAYKAIYDIARGRGLHPANQRQLEGRGVRVPEAWKAKKTRGTSAMPAGKR